ncbi:MAG: NRDE family protein, partial [Candidatus Latescibacterota bacterium]|nr:NRDE family protein [Candidatus Latescibacterota bacterium]
ANREEVYSRPSAPPAWQQQQRAFAVTDLQAGGTWLGVSETGVVVAVTNRRESLPAEDPRSRGHL